MTTCSRRDLPGLFAATGALAGSLMFAETASAAGPVVGPLNITENPHGPPARAVEAARNVVHTVANYPHAEETRLIAKIAAENGLKPENVVITTGSLEMLSLITAFWTQGGVQLLPSLTYDTHAKYAARQGLPNRRAPMAADFQIDFAAMTAGLGPDVKLAYVCNPNNPTGLLADPAALRAWCRQTAKTVPVVVDEAFIDLLPDPEVHSVADLVREGHDVIVAGTFSKAYGLAGLRLGYALATPQRAMKIRSVLATSHNTPALVAAEVAYKDRPYLAAAAATTAKGRAIIEGACKAAGLRTLPSVASYVWADLGPDAAGILKRLETKGVLLRQFGDAYPQWARIAVREPEALAALVRELPGAVGG
ncbi:pyridoxal phosphate-dependent aminotransferase [Caulobacter sp. NIBR2454]|uniref:pyridoxal phosphate-dependent aminotransferase n=1 Tax=Caulobacter sp. NIBR2454 TaxID=3015996 RepID=UPI0022B6208E|nr:histidinol-phosphate transaminase [Caulobacter sp. NIBR2454]